MRNGWFGVRMGVDGVTIGEGGGGVKGVNLILLSIFMILLAIVTLTDYGMSRRKATVNLDKEIPFMCTQCSSVYAYKIRDLQKMQKPFGAAGLTTQPTTGPAGEAMLGPMMGPMTLECPKCHQKTLTQAVECPKCQEIFVMKMNPAQNLFDDKCPKCGVSYAKAWQEKYRKTQGE
jgi:hypothetical protein